MSETSRFLEELEEEMQRFTREVRATAKAAAQVRELSTALRQANDRWKKLEDRIKLALEQLKELDGEVAAGLERLEAFKRNLVSDLEKALKDLRSEVHEAIAGEKEKLAETQNVIFKELQDHRDYLRTQLEDMAKKIDEIHGKALKAVAKAEASQKRAEAALPLSKWSLVIALGALAAMAWFWFQGVGIVRGP